MSDDQQGTRDDDAIAAEPSEPLLSRRDQPVAAPWFLERSDPPLPEFVPGSQPVWKLLVAAAIALFALWNVAALVFGSSLTDGGPHATLDFIWLAALVIACGVGIFALLRRR